MKKRRHVVLSLALVTSLLCGVPSSAAFNAGEKSKNYTYDNKTGNISIMADVDTNAGGTYYKYKGDIYYPSAIKLNTVVMGYYSSNGNIIPITAEKTVASGKTATAYARVPDGKKGVCTTNNPCNSIGTVKSKNVGQVTYPK